MKNVNYEAIKQVVQGYESLTSKQQHDAKKQIDVFWKEAIDKFSKYCQQDTAILSALEEIQLLREAKSFDLYNEFQDEDFISIPGGIIKTQNFSPELFAEARYLSNIWDKRRAKLEKRIEFLKKDKLALFRESRINKIEKEIKQYDKVVGHYRKCMEIQKRKKFYENNPEAEEAVKNMYYDLVQQYAKKAFLEELDLHPEMLCVQAPETFMSADYKYFDNGYVHSLQSAIKNKAINNIDSAILEEDEELGL